MSLLCWNCRGTGGTRTVRELLGIVSKERPEFFFLIETKATEVQMETLRIKLGFDSKVCVERTGFGGGLAFFWRITSTASLMSYSNNHIDMEISIPGQPMWRLTGFYGEADRTQGIHSHPSALIEGFNDALCDCDLVDLGMTGAKFTWEKGRGTEDWVEERLDRAVATMDWMEIHDTVQVKNIYTNSSDHCALLVDVRKGPERVAMRKFRFENAWLLEEGCAKVVEEAWQCSRDLNFQDRLVRCGERLWKWGGEYHRRFGARIKTLRRILHQLKEDRDPHAVEQFGAAEFELEGLLKAEEVFWKQRSKQLWLKQGDSNTKFFHRTATARRRNNTLLHIKDHSGDWAEGPGMQAEIIRYFNDIFGANTCTASIFDRVRARVTAEMNVSMSLPFTITDVKIAVFDMAPDKSPGPDGMSPAFFQHFWPVIGHDLTLFLIQCVEQKQFPPGFNDSHIVLIPKKPVPEKVSDLRPIALCNVVYKILAKMLANRMKVTLDHVVSQTQSAFVPDRLLTDNIILAGEVGHFLRRKTGGLQGWAALKLDMAKAYDRMEWAFLEGMVRVMGFDNGWVDLLMLCVTTVKYTILVNGEAAGLIKPTRGIRQGDPLSPYLFIICAEGLSILLQQAEARGDVHGVRVARGAPTINHLFFADDSLLFFRANEHEAKTIKECLDVYSSASGQLINYDKSSAVFTCNTIAFSRNIVTDLIGVHEAKDLGRYLGLPSVLGRNKIAIFRYIEEKVRARIGLWQHRLLSRAGKEILLKSIAQSLPIFTMSVFLLPMRTCDTLEKMFNRYWWGGGEAGKRGIHWLSWDRLCEPKKKGGLGFKKLHDFNLAMLAKQGLKGQILPEDGVLEAYIGTNPSYIWRSILAGQQVLKLGVARRIGDGRDTKIWGWNWLAGQTDLALVTPCVDELREARVHGLLDARDQWDEDIIRDLFLPADVVRILATPVHTQYRDCWRWVGDIQGKYTVKHDYQLLREMTSHQACMSDFHAWDALWTLPIPPKVKNFLWRCARNILPVRDNLRTKHVWIGGGCLICGFVSETIEHLFGGCAFAQEIWESTDVLNGRNVFEMMDAQIGHSTMRDRLKIIWKEGYTRPDSRRPRTRHATDNWTPPPQGTVKCNTDAALRGGDAYYGAVLRDHEGHFIAARCGRLVGEKDPYVAETLAAREALSWLKTQRIRNIILESDCLNFCNAFNKCISDYSYVGLIVKQCMAIANDIGNVTVSHVNRSANCVAHELARATHSTADTRGVFYSHMKIGIKIRIDQIGDCKAFMRMFERCLITHTLREGNWCADALTNLGQNSSWGTTILTLPPEEIQSILDSDAQGVAIRRIY
ncbi:PREDICTED: uncharacterized protein LOC109153209 [Ipomoea nil]|uniref:uncharacterized protein LOC109153209 n=1 Tax=Ipomoea nil TaxID=35883 RepID=UPI0009012296|nr:PREDICTED: uncharacterized protein LOC109153209 [Ipomoea nil]